MKKFLFLFVSAFALLSFKDKEIKINPALMGNYYASDTAKKATWVLKTSTSDDTKIEFYQGSDIVPTFQAVMKDSTHFKTPHEYSHTANQVTKMWTAKGEFLPNGQMELMVHQNDVSSGMKLSFSFAEDEKIIYTKR